ALPRDSATVLRNSKLHGFAGVCFGKRGEFFSAHILPAGHIFTVEGQAIPLKSLDRAFELLGFLNTPLARFSLNKYCGQHKYSGYVNLLPFIEFSSTVEVRQMTQRAIHLAARCAQFDEIQSLFSSWMPGASLAECASYIDTAIRESQTASRQCEQYCHEQALQAFKVSVPERELIESFRERQPKPQLAIKDADLENGCRRFIAHSLLSLSLGHAFGRW